MRVTSTNDPTLVVAAQAGDRRAVEDLVAAHLPMVYTIVRRALAAHPDVDDVVQETMLRALRDLKTLRVPESFTAWLAAIAVRQVSTHLHRRGLAAARSAPIEDLIDEPDAGAEFENFATLRLDLSHQRRQAVRASRWLDPDDRALLSLWWLENSGHLTRTELASALGVSLAHAGVRVQRMQAELAAARALVAALEVRPHCAGLEEVLAGWDGYPNPLWRKRISRHTRACGVCRSVADLLVPADRLLVGVGLAPVPLALAAGVLGKVSLGLTSGLVGSVPAAAGAGVGAKTGIIAHLLRVIVAHPIAATVVAGTVVASTAATATNWPVTAPAPPPIVVAVPTSPAPLRLPVVSTPAVVEPPVRQPAPSPTGPLPLGPVSLESVNQAGMFMSTADTYGVLIKAGPASDGQTRDQATFTVVRGQADGACFSFRLRDGRYLRHSSWRLRVSSDDGTPLFQGDATFCVRAGSVAGSLSLESSNYPGWFLRHRGNELWVDHSDGSAGFLADSSFRVRAPL